MSRVALFIGSSRYQPDLNVPPRGRDLDELHRILMQPEFRCPVKSLHNSDLQETQEAIDRFCQERHPDEQLILVFSGYGFQDPEGRLYLLTPNTVLDGGIPITTTLLPLSVVQGMLNGSPARQQVVILDCCFRQSFSGDPITLESPVDVESQLRGDDRAILTTFTFTRHTPRPDGLRSWGYLRYLAEGIETAGADTNSDGVVSAEELHLYAQRKLKIAAPARKPACYGSEEARHRPLLEVPVQAAAIRYRKLLEPFISREHVDAIGSRIVTDRALLEDMQRNIGLSAPEAAAIEFQALRPVREYQQRLQLYHEQFFNPSFGQDPSLFQEPHSPMYLRQALELTEEDVAGIEDTIHDTPHPEHSDSYQADLARYEQVFLAAVQRQYPLSGRDIQMLNHYKVVLGLRDEDVQAVEAAVLARLQQSPGSPTVLQGDPQISPNERAVQDAALRKSQFTPADQPLVATDLVDQSAPQARTELQPPARLEEPVPPRPQRQERQLSKLLLIPILLAIPLAIYAGWRLAGAPRVPFFQASTRSNSDTNNREVARLNTLGRNSAEKGDNQAALTSYDDALRLDPNSAVTYVNRGVSHERLGDLDAARKDYDTAISLQEENKQRTVPQNRALALSYSNRSHVRYDQQDYQGALDDASKAVDLAPNLVQAYINRANANFALGKTDLAFQDYNRAINLKQGTALGPKERPILATAYIDRGNVLLASNKLNAALKDYNQAIDLNPSAPEAFYNRAVAYQTMNNTTRASEDFQAAATRYQKQGKPKLAQEASDLSAALQQTPPTAPPSTQPSSPEASSPTPSSPAPSSSASSSPTPSSSTSSSPTPNSSTSSSPTPNSSASSSPAPSSPAPSSPAPSSPAPQSSI